MGVLLTLPLFITILYSTLLIDTIAHLTLKPETILVNCYAAVCRRTTALRMYSSVRAYHHFVGGGVRS